MYGSGLDIPEGHSGRFYLKHSFIPEGKNISMQYGRGIFKAPTDLFIHILKEVHYPEDIVWMSDTPMEMETHSKAVKAARGRVLVGGLGIGYFLHKISKKPHVTSIDVIEINQDVINLVWNSVRTPNTNLITGDLFKVLDHLVDTNEQYDFIYLDIWPDQNHDNLRDFIIPLRLKAKPLVQGDDSKIICWVEDECRRMFADYLSTLALAGKSRGLSDHDSDDEFVDPFVRYLRDNISRSASELINDAYNYATKYREEIVGTKFEQYFSNKQLWLPIQK